MITNKNIDDVLKKQYYERIKEFFKEHSSIDERVKFLKKVYGTGGWRTPQRGDFIDSVYHNESGIQLTKRENNRKEEEIKMNWTKVAVRLQQIIESESQMSLF